MNKQDRKELAAAIELLHQAETLVEEAMEKIADLASAEREKFDNMSEGLQASENGQRLEQAAEALESANEDDVLAIIQNVIGNLEAIE